MEGTPADTNLVQEISQTVCDHVTLGHLPGVCVGAKTYWEVEREKQTKWSNICSSRSQTIEAHTVHTHWLGVFCINTLIVYPCPNDLPALITEVTKHTDVTAGQISLDRIVYLHLHPQTVLQGTLNWTRFQLRCGQQCSHLGELYLTSIK